MKEYFDFWKTPGGKKRILFLTQTFLPNYRVGLSINQIIVLNSILRKTIRWEVGNITPKELTMTISFPVTTYEKGNKEYHKYIKTGEM